MVDIPINAASVQKGYFEREIVTFTLPSTVFIKNKDI